MSKGKDKQAKPSVRKGNGGEWHQEAKSTKERMTTNQGVVVSDDQNSLKVGGRGSTLLEDFHLREKITHFDHERIPERVVHARGYGAHGYFQAYESHASLTKAAFLQNPSEKTPVFVRFSTVAGSKGSPDTARDVRGFAVKFYTQEGNYDLVGNNMPVFFIQDAIKFPDLIHAVKPAPDRDFPQAQSAHDSFWDFVSLMPESMHMLVWVMSDRAIPRSLRMMEGFGIHTFRMINADGESTLVKFHWRPKQGIFSLIWDEAVVISGADPDFHRRDMWNSIEAGDYPEWELSVQVFTEEEANKFDYDVLDPTKLIPEEDVPLTPLGKMVLDRNVDNFFAETEQVAFCPANIVPGIDFSNDPLLQGRLFSYLDTQLTRLGGPNFQQIPVNQPKCPMQNLQRDGHMQMDIPKGRVSNEPSSLDDGLPRECDKTGFKSYPEKVSGEKLRIRPESFADHYTQARLFYKSMTGYEQDHIAGGFAFELGKCQKIEVRERMIAHLLNIDKELAGKVADNLGMNTNVEPIKPAVPVKDMPLSDALSQYKKTPDTLAGKKVGLLTTDGIDAAFFMNLEEAVMDAGANIEVVALKAGPMMDSEGNEIIPDHFLSGAPSALFDSVVVAPTEDMAKKLADNPNAVDWIRMANAHLKVIGYTDQAMNLLKKSHIKPGQDEGIVLLDMSKNNFDDYLNAAKKHRIWDRS
ncbi:Catalase C [Polystyrenella longa]|uniref:Catalase n=1 Tax=Polystyrenella longa TaxID=2528007 RepID=A0A518CLE5_9PLAN|nr:catalase [Polystyrenella longa]QDU80049.1 Catalase C [Polystyrenella longa]